MIAASGGNHGVAVAYAAHRLGIPATIFVPAMSAKQQTELRCMHATGDYSIADLAELFSIGRTTVYRTLQRQATREG